MPSDRLKKLVLMLSSEQDGEIVAAARAIGRNLKDTGLDWHWLADHLSGEYRADPKRSDGFNARGVEEYRSRVGFCFAHRADLRSREHEFITQLQNRFNEYGAETFLSPKQRAWIDDIYKRLGGEK